MSMTGFRTSVTQKSDIIDKLYLNGMSPQIKKVKKNYTNLNFLYVCQILHKEKKKRRKEEKKKNMKKMKILILNGPNLNLLGNREKEIYGNQSFQDYLPQLQKKFPEAEIDYFQTNIEGELINQLQLSTLSHYDGIVLNAGGYTHTSVAIADAILAIDVPVIEVHISNILAREKFRHTSMIAPVCQGSIFGFGLFSYELAIYSILHNPDKKR